MSGSRCRCALLALGLTATGVAATGFAAQGAAPAPGATGLSSELRFEEVATSWGLSFRHHTGASGRHYMVETMVGGVVIFDYDDDGDSDVFFVDGGVLPGSEAKLTPTGLYRNDAGRFVDVTSRAGIDFASYGCGGVAGDYDGDGDLDLYLTGFGENALFENLGDGHFEEVPGAAGAQSAEWSSAAVFGDVDLDGDLDLFVADYVDFAFDNHKFCGDEAREIRGYCHPDVYEGRGDHLFRNLGDGTFEDVTSQAGLDSSREAGLGALFSDLDGDLFPEIYVANDLDPNLLFRNRGDGTFEDLSLLAGTGYGNTGKPEAGMGVESADFDGDGRFDLFVTNFALEANALYGNRGDLLFLDRRFPANLAESSISMLGFGAAAGDFDHDADLDLAIANGHVLDNAGELSAVKQYAMRNQLMENVGGGRFVDREDVGLDQVRVSRGLALGDLDLDGDLDIVVLNSGDLAEVYANRGATFGWLQVALRSGGSNRFGLGARIELATAERRQLREVRSSSSYLSQNALPVHFGLGESSPQSLERLDVFWPSGRRLRLAEVPPSVRLLVVE